MRIITDNLYLVDAAEICHNCPESMKGLSAVVEYKTTSDGITKIKMMDTVKTPKDTIIFQGKKYEVQDAPLEQHHKRKSIARSICQPNCFGLTESRHCLACFKKDNVTGQAWTLSD